MIGPDLSGWSKISLLPFPALQTLYFMSQPCGASDIPLGPLWVNEVLMAEPGFGSPAPNTARKGSKPQTSKSTVKGNDGSGKGKLGGEGMRRMGLREKSYSKETHQSATSSQRKQIKRLLLGLFGTILEIPLPRDGQGTNQHRAGKFHYIFCPLISFSVKVFSPFSPFFLSLCFSANSVDSPQAEEKLPAITNLQILSMGNRGRSSQEFVTDSS